MRTVLLIKALTFAQLHNTEIRYLPSTAKNTAVISISTSSSPSNATTSCAQEDSVAWSFQVVSIPTWELRNCAQCCLSKHRLQACFVSKIQRLSSRVYIAAI